MNHYSAAVESIVLHQHRGVAQCSRLEVSAVARRPEPPLLQRARLLEAWQADRQRAALLYEEMGEYAKAEPMYVKSRDIAKKVQGEGHSNYAMTLHNLANVYGSMHEYDTAEKLYVQACDILRKASGEEDPDYALSLSSLGGIYRRTGQYAKARPLLVRASQIYRKVLGPEHPDYATSLNNLAYLYEVMGEYANAERLYLQHRDIAEKVLGKEHPTYASCLIDLARLYSATGEYVKAEPLAEAGLDAEVKSAGRVLASLPEAQAMTFWGTLTGPDLLLSILRRLPQDNAQRAYDAIWRTRGLVSHTVTQRRRVTAESPEAREVWGRLETTARQLAQLTLAVSKPSQRQARQGRLAELNDEKERLQGELARLSAGFRRSQQIRTATVADFAALLPEDTAVVELVDAFVWDERKPGQKRTGQWQYDAFVLRRGGGRDAVKIAWVQLGPASPINRAVAAWRRAIQSERTMKASSPAAVLRQRVWDKVEPHLAGCSSVIIIPDSDLDFVPWAAIPGRRPGSCLIEDYAIATASYGRQLYTLLAESHSPAPNVLLAGGVAYDREPSAAPQSGELAAADTRTAAMKDRMVWKPLPGSLEEVAAVAGLWKGPPRPVVLRGNSADEVTLRLSMPHCRYIHLATHGFFADQSFRAAAGHDVAGEQLFGSSQALATARRARVTLRNPMILSGVVLAGANLPPKADKLGLPTGEDGILTAEEIVNLNLRGTELVVLSACDTGLGKVAGGEGVMGLTRAFHLAGARNVIASLWKVDDKATAALMKLFYHRLWKENKRPIEALREAQLFLYRNPDLIDEMATSRSFDLTEPTPLPDGGRAKPKARTAATRRWAAFVLSGPGD